MSFLSSAMAHTGGELADAAHDTWQLITRLGEAQILLPAMLVALLWLLLVPRATGVALWWLGGTFAAALLTTITKVAFIGYEVGYAPWDYTGVSGHAMFAAAVLPMLAGIMAGGASPRRRRAAVWAGYALAALIAYSRLPVRAHSLSESLIGLALGGLASALALARAPLPDTRPPLWLGTVLVVWVLSLPLGAPPSPTHSWVVRLSLALSDRPQPYQRWQMHRDYRREMRKRHAAAAVASTREAPPLR